MLLRRSGEGVICLAREHFTFYELSTAVSTGNLKKTLKRLAKKIDPRKIYMFNARVVIQLLLEKLGLSEVQRQARTTSSAVDNPDDARELLLPFYCLIFQQHLTVVGNSN